MPLAEKVRKAMKATLRRYQLEGVQFLQRTRGNAIIGDDMGLGKTIIALAWVSIHPELRPVLILCPSKARWVWLDLMLEHSHLRCEVLESKTPRPLHPETKIAVINYDIIEYWERYLLAFAPQVFIIDECHRLKNKEINRTVTAQAIAKRADHVIPMSGTQLLNAPVEFWVALNMVAPRVFGSFWKYAMRYCNPKRGWRGKGWNFSGASNLDELNQRIQPYFLRRTKEECLPELPLKQRMFLEVDISNHREYRAAERNFIKEWLSSKESRRNLRSRKAAALVKVGHLKQLCGMGKVDAAVEWVQDYVKSTGKKVVVFAYHKNVHQALCKRLQRTFVVANGHLGKSEEKRFQNDSKCLVYVGTIKANSEATTLTAASVVLFVEFGWTPSLQDQAEDRICRMGQKADKLFIYYLMGHKTEDFRMWNEIIEEKRRIIQAVIDGKDSKKNNATILLNYMRKVGKHDEGRDQVKGERSKTRKRKTASTHPRNM